MGSLLKEENTWLDDLSPAEFAEYERRYSWIAEQARVNQLTPLGNWFCWLLLAGRGFGKTRTASEDVAGYGLDNPGTRIAVVAETFSDGRDVCIEGESGLLSCLPESMVKLWNRSLGELVLSNGTIYKLFSGDKPDGLRGYQFHRAWCLSAGTPIATTGGDKPIESIAAGDKVLTSQGYRSVEATGSRVAKLHRLELEDGRVVIGSAEHPFATQDGWKPLCELTNNDRISAWVKDGTKTFTAISSGTKDTTRTGSTGLYGKSTTALSPRVDTSTTLMGSRTTTGSKTCNSSHLKSTAIYTKNTETTPVHVAARRSSPRSITSELGIASRVGQGLESKVASLSLEPVSIAELSFKPDLDTIAVKDVSTLAAVGKVYNLQIEGTHEYFANGLLTHNCDELAKVRYARETWTQLVLGMRLGDNPQVIVTTTPRPISLLKDLRDRETTVVTTGSTFDNAANLADPFLDEIRTRYENTRTGRQELYAEILDDTPGALWSRAMLDDAHTKVVPDMTRIVVAIDPAVTSGEDSDSTGIIVAGKGVDGHAYVLADRTCRLSPDGWARRAVAAYEEFGADRIVAEVNNGGDLVQRVIQTVSARASYKKVHASRGKRVRAEPIAALYEQRKVHHLGSLQELEDQMVTFVPEGMEESPDRVDALVWALTELMLERKGRTKLGVIR